MQAGTTPAAEMSIEEMAVEIYQTIEYFRTAPELDGGRTFGCDWPTMAMLYPELVGRVRDLKAEYRRRKALPV